MKIRNKILIYFSTIVIGLLGVSLFSIYILFSEYREEEFQQQQKEKIKYTVRLIAEYKEMSEKLANIMDQLTIHDFYDEKMMVFDEDKQLIFSSIDDLPIDGYETILKHLTPDKDWLETKEDDYDVIGVFIESNQRKYYAISKAYDAFGYSKMYFLRNVLVGIYISISIVVILVSLYLSNIISKPITRLAEQMKDLDLGGSGMRPVAIESSSHELRHLSNRFNELIKRTNEAFSFQKHTTHHISHQLKTPISILVSELERIKANEDIHLIKADLEGQITRVKSLGSIVNVLLEISKVTSGSMIRKDETRLDELIFDLIDELSILHPNHHFEVNYSPEQFDESTLMQSVNEMLIKQAFLNLLVNCVEYSDNEKSELLFDSRDPGYLKILFTNTGLPVSEDEQKFLFDHFFRGKNSQGVKGFGLGLVLTKQIIDIHKASITYANPQNHINVFEVSFPLS